MANVGVLWIYVLVCLAAADEVDREYTDSEEDVMDAYAVPLE